jgi:hypothetical protein
MSHPKEIKTLLAKTSAALSKNTPTQAGQKTSEAKVSDSDQRQSADKNLVVAAVNQMFAELEVVYHNQFRNAFPSPEKLHYAKKLWFSNLSHLSPETIIQATHQAIRSSDFLPTVHGILKFCDALDSHGLPSARNAYIEACNASKPRRDHSWSHPAVYFAGQDSDWFFLESSNEQKAFPVFKSHYDKLCERVRSGEQLTVEPTPALPSSVNRRLNSEQRREALDKLMQDTGL